MDGLPAGAAFRVNRTPGILTLTDDNTTIGYCRYNPDGEVEYIFVHPAQRRRGFGQYLLKLVEQDVRRPLSFQSPISPLGRALQDAYANRRADLTTPD
jgi:GNAT superfamily N-acetyltransferase